MGPGGHLVPLDQVPRPVAAKDRVGGVLHIGVGVVADGGQHLRGVVAGSVPLGDAAQPPRAPGVGGHLPGAAPHFGHRRGAGQHGPVVFHGGRGKFGAAALQIRHGPAHAVLGNLQPEVVPRLQQNGVARRRSGAQPLPHGAVGGLAEVPALGVFEVGPPRRQCDFHIGQRRTRQNAGVAPLGQVGQNQPLPVAIQRVGAATAGQLHAAAPGSRLQQQMDLGIMAQRLVVPHALHGGREGLFVQNAALAKAHLQPEPAVQHALQNFQLNLAHELQMNLAQRVVPHHMELGVFLLQRAQRPQGVVGVGALGQLHPVVEHRLQNGHPGVRLAAQPLPGIGFGQPRYGAHRSGGGLADEPELAAGVQPQLVGLLLKGGPGVRPGAEGGFHLQDAAGDLQIGQPGALVVGADLEHLRAKIRRGGGHPGVPLQAGEQRVNALHPQRRPEIAGENLPPRNGGHQILPGNVPGQKGVHQRFTAQGQRLGPGGGGGVGGKVHAAVPEPPAQLPQPNLPVGAGQVHLVDKNQRWNVVPLQKPPQRGGVALHPVCARDDQNGIVQHLQGALRLGGKVHMAGGVQQRDAGFLQRHAAVAARRQRELGLFGKDGDAPRPLQRVGVQKGVPVVHPPQLADHPGAKEQCLRQGRLAAVNVGQNADDQSFHNSLSPIF